jgi:hypothetical protein
MSKSFRIGSLVLLLAVVTLPTSRPSVPAQASKVQADKTPNDGIQSQAVIDSRGSVHLLYFKGDPAAGNLYYVSQTAASKTFSAPMRVNSQPGSAIAVGTIRGGQISLGKDNRVYVAWNGSGKALPKRPNNGSPMLYARMNNAGTAFEPQRNLMRKTFDLDGGGTVAADRQGNVYVAWHGHDRPGDEAHRRLWVAKSSDGGKTFAAEVPALSQSTGACGCCGSRAFTDHANRLYVLYRAATENVNRDIYLLASRDQGGEFQGANVQKWKINACPMSSESFAEGPNGVFGAWETNGQVYFGKVDPRAMTIPSPIGAPGSRRDRKHPTLAVNRKGEILLAWTEGTGWERGGDLAWQVFSPSGKATVDEGRIPNATPVWGLPSAVALPNGKFDLFY